MKVRKLAKRIHPGNETTHSVRSWSTPSGPLVQSITAFWGKGKTQHIYTLRLPPNKFVRQKRTTETKKLNKKLYVCLKYIFDQPKPEPKEPEVVIDTARETGSRVSDLMDPFSLKPCRTTTGSLEYNPEKQ